MTYVFTTSPALNLSPTKFIYMKNTKKHFDP